MLCWLILEPFSIALVSDWSPPRVGGIERHVAGLAQALARRGHAVHLLTTTPNPSAIPGVTIHSIQTPMFGDVAAPALWRVGELRARLVDARVDLVHAHGMFSTLAIGGLLAARGAGIASVTTHHSLLRHSPTLPAAWLTYRLFSRHATVVTAVSHAAAEDARRVSGRADVPLLPNGFDRMMWQKVRLKADATYERVPLKAEATSNDVRGVRLQPDHDGSGGGNARQPDHDGSVRGVRLQPDRAALRVVSVMRLARKKSPRDLIDAVPTVLARVHRDVVFTIIGDGPERQRLERRADRLGVASYVEFLGACEPARVADVLARSSLFALPSRREAFGIALLEARAAGLPVVACASGGVPEVVDHGRQGLLTNTPQTFAEAIVKLINNAALREKFAAAACDGLERYDWDRVVDRHETVYRQAIAVNRRGRRR